MSSGTSSESHASGQRGHRITRPQSPSLSTRGRARPVNHPTREEEEEQQLQEALKNRIKSKPLDPRVFQPPKLNAIEAKPFTVPQPFSITQTKKVSF